MHTQITPPPSDTLVNQMAGRRNETATANPETESPLPTHPPGALELVEFLLKDAKRVDRLNRHAEFQALLFPRFLMIAVASYAIFGLILVVLLNLAPAEAYPTFEWLRFPPAFWLDRTALSLPLAYVAGIVLAACVCLPSFYFYSLLAEAKLTWLQITSLVGKGMAGNAILLLGLLPAYVAVVLGMIIFEVNAEVLQYTLLFGLLLPFVAGLWGMRAIFLGVLELTSDLPDRWHWNRLCFMRRLVLAWSAVYTAVVPVMIFRLWEYFAGWVA